MIFSRPRWQIAWESDLGKWAILLKWLFWVVCITPPVAAEVLKPPMRFENPLSRAEAVGHQMGGVNSITQDHLGFIWIGSENGLGRFDGRTLKLYQTELGNPNALPASYIRQIAVDHKGVLWVTSEGGLARYNVETDDFTRFKQIAGVPFLTEQISAIAVAADNTLYIGAGRDLHIIDPTRTQMRALRPHSPVAVDANSEQIRDIAVGPDQRVWLATAGNGVAIFDPDSEQFEYLVHQPGNPNSLAYNGVAAIFHDDRKQVWLGTYGGGISRLDPATGEFSHFANQRDDPGSLRSNVVHAILQDSEGIIWAALDHGGLARFDPQSQSFFSYQHSPSNPTSLASNQLRALFEDANRDLWLGAFPSGVSFYNRSTQIFRHYTSQAQDSTSLSHNAVLQFLEARDGTVWIGTEGGLNALNPKTGLIRRYAADPSNPYSLKADPVLAIEEDRDGQLWIGTWGGGLHRFDPQTERFYSYLPDPDDPHSINSQFVWDVLLDRANRLWVATQTGGLNRYQRETDNFRHFVHDPGDPASISGNYAVKLHEDRYGKIWVGTFTGLDLLDPESEVFTHVPHETGSPEATSSRNIKSIYEDSRGLVWVGTHYRGVNIFDRGSGTFTHLDVADGLPSSNISSIIEDQNGAIWLATTNGLAKLTYPDWQVTVYGRHEGVAGSNFNRDASLRTRAGLMYFGSSEGVTVFDPAELGRQKTDFPVRITQLRILNQTVPIGEMGSPLQRHIVLTNALQLSYRDSMFSFDFAALNYRQAQAVRYSYMLEGFDQSWYDIGNNNSATYTNLSPGRYRFRIRAADALGDWVEGQSIEVVITPPFWRTWWAYSFYLLVLLSVFYAQNRYMQLRRRAAIYQNKSITDPLTGLYNRYGIAQLVQGIFANAETQKGTCVMLLDIDHFKNINDELGHDAGDRILQQVCTVVQQCIRQSDHFGRWGGEEFILLCASQTVECSVELADKIRAAVASATYEGELVDVSVSLSIGVAEIQPEDTFNSALKRADLALYQAKARGRNRVIIAD